MVSLLSPGIQIVEKDNTLIVPSVATTVAGTVGAFVWGQVNDPTLIVSEKELVETFGQPNDTTYEHFFTAANFLSYSNQLFVVRVVGDDATNASSSATLDFDGDGTTTDFTLGFTPIDENSITVTVDGVVAVPTTEFTVTGTTLSFVTAPAAGTGNIIVTEKQVIQNDDQFELLTQLPSSVYARHPGDLGNSLEVILADSTTFANLTTDEQEIFGDAPAANEIHYAVIDADGTFTGVAGTLLERREFLSTIPGDQFDNGEISYFKTFINRSSLYIRLTGDLTDVAPAGKVTLSGGVSDDQPSDGALQLGFDLFKQKEKLDVAILMTGPASATVAEHVLTEVAEDRKDTVVCISPELTDVLNNTGSEVDDIKAYRTLLGSSSYGIMDNNWKLMYDTYNDTNRWVPCNGDVAGILARSDELTDPWISPAGYNRGIMKGVIRLAFDANQGERDILYTSGINPIITEFGVGTLLFGDRTLLTRPSAFDRINVRRLFIVMEKSISRAAKFVLFETNDEFTRASVRNIITPFLREIQGSRGITDFRVICDETNNTGQIIDNNELVVDIAVKPSRSINFITLNFIATRTSVSFEEIV